MAEEKKRPFWASCTECGHVWTAAYLPMEMRAFSKLTKALHCPNCAAGSNKITPAAQAGGKLKKAR